MPRRGFGEGAVQVQQRPQNFEDASIMGRSSWMEAGVKGSQPDPVRQVTCARNGRDREVDLPWSCGAQKIMSPSCLRLNFTLLDSGFVLF